MCRCGGPRLAGDGFGAPAGPGIGMRYPCDFLSNSNSTDPGARVISTACRFANFSASWRVYSKMPQCGIGWTRSSVSAQTSASTRSGECIGGGGGDEGDPAGLSGCRLLTHPFRQGAGLAKTSARKQQPDLPTP